MLGVWRLQLLRELARRGTIKAAADALSVTPSAVSQQLAVLEREAGIPLLEPRGRRLQLTLAGQLLVRHTDLITGAIASAEADLASLKGAVAGTFAVAAFATAARSIMPAAMTALGTRHPDLRITLKDLEAEESLAALRMDEIDLAIVDSYEGDSPSSLTDLNVHEFLIDPLYVALPPNERRLGPVRLADLREAHWIMDSDWSHIDQVSLRACRENGFEPRIRSKCKDFAVILALVEAGLGVSILPGLALHKSTVHATIREIDPPMSRRVVAVTRPERSRHPTVLSVMSELDRFGSSYAPTYSLT